MTELSKTKQIFIECFKLVEVAYKTGMKDGILYNVLDENNNHDDIVDSYWKQTIKRQSFLEELGITEKELEEYEKLNE